MEGVKADNTAGWLKLCFLSVCCLNSCTSACTRDAETGHTSQVLVSEAFPEGWVTGEGLHNVMPDSDLCQVHQRLLQPHLQTHITF